MTCFRITALLWLCSFSLIVSAQKKKEIPAADKNKIIDSVTRFVRITSVERPCVSEHELVLNAESVKGTGTDLCIFFKDPAQADTNFYPIRILDIIANAPYDTLRISLLLNATTYPHGIYRLALIDSSKQIIARSSDIIKDHCTCFETPEKVKLQEGNFKLRCARELINFNFHLYTSDGFEVFATNNFSFEWNMLYLGAPVSPGIYYYSASFEEPSVFGNKTKQPAGSITIIP